MYEISRGTAVPLNDGAFERAAGPYGYDADVLRAIWRVESGKGAFAHDGRLTILCEKHVFFKYLPKDMRADAVAMGIARRKWIHPKKGGYSDQGSTVKKYRMFKRMVDYHPAAALMAISMGGPQIMGFNAEAAGFSNALDMFNKMRDGEQAQLDGLIRLLRSFGLNDAIRHKQWSVIARKYNGSGQVTRYATALANAYAEIKAGRGLPKRKVQKYTPPPVTRQLPVPTVPKSAPKRTLVDLLVDLVQSLFGKDNR